MKLFLYKSIDANQRIGLFPVNEDDEEKLKTLIKNDIKKCELKNVRNYQYHKMYFAFLKLLVDNTEKFKDVEEALYYFKYKSGHVDYYKVNEDILIKPKSISFEAMEEDEFQKFFSKCIDIALKEIVPNFTKMDIVEASNAVVLFS